MGNLRPSASLLERSRLRELVTILRPRRLGSSRPSTPKRALRLQRPFSLPKTRRQDRVAPSTFRHPTSPIKRNFTFILQLTNRKLTFVLCSPPPLQLAGSSSSPTRTSHSRSASSSPPV